MDQFFKNYLLEISIIINILNIITIFYVGIHYDLPKRIMERLFNVPNVNSIRNTNIIVMGDSRINTDWNKLMSRNDIVSLHGGQIEDLIKKIGMVNQLKPKVCLIMVGINDMFWIKTPEKTFEDYKGLIKILKQQPVEIVIQSLLYVGPIKTFYKEQNREVDVLNGLLKEYSMENGIIFLDLNKSFSNGKHLIMKYSSDGVHISDEGYELWKQKLLPVLSQINL